MLKTIGQKLTAVGVVVFALVGASAGAGLWVADTLGAGLQDTMRSAAILRNHMQADMMHDALRADVLSALLAGSPAAGLDMNAVTSELAEHIKSFRAALAENDQLASDQLTRDALAKVQKPLDDYITAANGITALAASNPAEATQKLGAFGKQFSLLETAMEETSDSIEAVARKMSSDALARAEWARKAMSAALVLGALLSLILMVFARRSIANPIRELAGDMHELARGRTDIALKGANRSDEVGSIGRAVAAFQLFLTDRARKESEEADGRRRQEKESADRQSAIDDAKAEDLKAFVHAVELAFKALADGDLTVRMSQAAAPEFEPIRATFNESVTALDDAIGAVVGSIGAIRTGLSEINVASNDLAHRTEQQAASLEETVAALSEVTGRVKETAASAAKARSAAKATQDNAEQGGQVVSRAIEAMSGIERSSQQINQIIGVIDEIAFQTNLLALNAGVEAARAGDAGKGFAVVASEVRGLAQRSAEAAKEIKELISVSRQQVNAGVELVSASGTSLKDIVGSVGVVTDVVADIAESAGSQAVSLQEVSTAADQMDKVTQQNAAMVEEATAAAQALSNETDELAQLVQRFRTKAGNTMIPAGSRKNGQPDYRSPSRSGPGRNVVQMKAAGARGAAAKAASKQAGWEEF